MDSKHKNWIFYSFLPVIVLANLIFIWALASHFVFGKPVPHVQFLLVTFAAEIVGSFIYAWKRVVANTAQNAKPKKKTRQQILSRKNLQLFRQLLIKRTLNHLL